MARGGEPYLARETGIVKEPALEPRRRLDDAQRRAWLRLLRSENVGPVTFRALINRFGGAGAALDALPELSARGGLRRPIRVRTEREADDELRLAARLGARLIALGEPGYPPALGQIEAAPPLIYVSGSADILERPMIAVVGARNCSASGRRLVQGLAAELGAAGLVIVSGLARGIDGAAHEASLSTGTVAVLAGGHARLYPPEHEDLARRIAGDGALIGEMPPDWVPRGKDFPRRNRIIAGVARGVVVVEAAMRSGSLITARLAAEQGREVFAVPGSPLDPRAAGTNRLIRNGATLTRSAADVMEVLAPILGAPPDLPAAEPEARPLGAVDIDDDGRDRVVAALGPSPVEIDEAIRHTGLPPGMVMLALVELELAGRLERHPGQRVSLV